MSAEVVDFVARLSAIRLGLKTAQHAEGVASRYRNIEKKDVGSGPSAQVDLTDLQSALEELRTELIKKQVELGSEGMDVLNAIRIGAQAEVIMGQLTKLVGEISVLKSRT